MSSMNARLTKLEQRTPEAMPLCRAIAGIGEIDPGGWRTPTMTLDRLAGESDAELRERAARAVSERFRGNLALVLKELAGLLPG